MKLTKRLLHAVLGIGLVLASGGMAHAQAVDALPSWSDGATKRSFSSPSGCRILCGLLCTKRTPN
jgi:hypothetical protein